MEILLDGDPTVHDNFAIRVASSEGRLDIVTALLNDERVDPTAENNEAIKRAASNGHAAVVKELLKWRGNGDVRVDPTTENNLAIRMAAMNEHAAVVKELLKWRGDGGVRVDPTVGNNYAIQIASTRGSLEIVIALLNDERVDPTSNNEEAIRMASANGYDKVVKELLAWQNGFVRVNPATNNNFPIKRASRNGHIEVVKLLLQDARVDATADNNRAIRIAAARGVPAVVKELLKWRGPGGLRVNPMANHNHAIKKATTLGNLEMVKLLLDNTIGQRVDLRIANHAAFRRAAGLTEYLSGGQQSQNNKITKLMTFYYMVVYGNEMLQNENFYFLYRDSDWYVLVLSDVEREDLLSQKIFTKTLRPPHLIHFKRVKRLYLKLVENYESVFTRKYEKKLQEQYVKEQQIEEKRMIKQRQLEKQKLKKQKVKKKSSINNNNQPVKKSELRQMIERSELQRMIYKTKGSFTTVLEFSQKTLSMSSVKQNLKQLKASVSLPNKTYESDDIEDLYVQITSDSIRFDLGEIGVFEDHDYWDKAPIGHTRQYTYYRVKLKVPDDYGRKYVWYPRADNSNIESFVDELKDEGDVVASWETPFTSPNIQSGYLEIQKNNNVGASSVINIAWTYFFMKRYNDKYDAIPPELWSFHTAKDILIPLLKFTDAPELKYILPLRLKDTTLKLKF